MRYRNALFKTAIVTAAVLFVMLMTAGCQSNAVSYEDIIGDIDGFFKERGELTVDEDVTEASWYRPGDSLTDWIMIFEADSGQEVDKDKYLSDLKKYVEQAYDTEEKLDRVKATEWQRISLAVIACGGDPTGFGKDGKGNNIDLIHDGTYGWIHTKALDTQGSNALIYSLKVIDAGGISIPKNGKYTKETMLKDLMRYRNEDGGFSLSGGESDIDITAMAVQALSPYSKETVKYKTGDREMTISEVIDGALEYLSGKQSSGGYYNFGGGYSSDTLSQVIMAICDAGFDPREDERFEKSGKDPVDALMTFRNEDGGFASALDSEGKPEESNLLSTCQAGNAIVALTKIDDEK